MYPKKKYAHTGGHVVVNAEHEEKALGPGWSDIPQPPQPSPADDAQRKAAADNAEAEAAQKQAADAKADAAKKTTEADAKKVDDTKKRSEAKK